MHCRKLHLQECSHLSGGQIVLKVPFLRLFHTVDNGMDVDRLKQQEVNSSL